MLVDAAASPARTPLGLNIQSKSWKLGSPRPGPGGDPYIANYASDCDILTLVIVQKTIV